jgi:hypothetical protein
MSRGPGRIGRLIAEAFDTAERGKRFTTAELCRLVYPGIDRVENKHRVAVLRAAHSILEKQLQDSPLGESDWVVDDGEWYRRGDDDPHAAEEFRKKSLAARSMYRDGKPIAAIMRELGASRVTVWRWIAHEGLTPY